MEHETRFELATTSRAMRALNSQLGGCSRLELAGNPGNRATARRCPPPFDSWSGPTRHRRALRGRGRQRSRSPIEAFTIPIEVFTIAGMRRRRRPSASLGLHAARRTVFNLASTLVPLPSDPLRRAVVRPREILVKGVPGPPDRGNQSLSST